LIALGAGIGLIGYAVATGEGNFGLLLIFPVFYGSGGLMALGGLLLFAGVFMSFIGFAMDAGYEVVGMPGIQSMGEHKATGGPKPTGRKSNVGGVVLIGPVPIVFGSSPRSALWAVIMAIVMLMVIAFMVF